MESTVTRPAIDVAPTGARPGLAFVLALLAIPGSTLAWDLPAGGFWIGLPLAVAAIALGVVARRRLAGTGRSSWPSRRSSLAASWSPRWRSARSSRPSSGRGRAQDRPGSGAVLRGARRISWPHAGGCGVRGRDRAAAGAGRRLRGRSDDATLWYENIRAVEWKVRPDRSRWGSRIAFVARFLGRRLCPYDVDEVRELVPGGAVGDEHQSRGRFRWRRPTPGRTPTAGSTQ